ncbi:uncharacterized protein LOC131875285 [Cryptomeria japonica]|uniref:uncharacterized protein LOC131875285 n=1 Tax=Cryptomeria japonica TaxID=3369 RepID=UPI0027DA12B4|nr:uncharacterized protein LOC131875285 [Cryptomeria japonica]
MDWSHALIPLEGKKMHLTPEPKANFTVLKSADPRDDILFIETRLGTHMCLSKPHNNLDQITPSLKDESWTLEFDGSCANAGSGVGVVLVSPDGYKFPHAFKLELANTNNTTEYEAFLLGLGLAKEKGIKQLKAIGDVELVVKQVRKNYMVKNSHLKHYKNTVWDSIEFFDAFSIESVLRSKNTRVDSLAISASLLLPHPDFVDKTFQVEVIYKPSILDNVEH